MLDKDNEPSLLLEKMLFFELTNKQFSKFPNSEYYATYNILKEEFKDLIDYHISK
ncbi:hypothetical protein [Aestuariibaculum suncheonense]|uniref:hypothetical protein n=1 Tax=Aestuariibaculum suncheonense TaxID=1028745 RepID=UPI0019D5B655|nr:hypothetical protein [Aestuariibaculum suncheonense]